MKARYGTTERPVGAGQGIQLHAGGLESSLILNLSTMIPVTPRQLSFPIGFDLNSTPIYRGGQNLIVNGSKPFQRLPSEVFRIRLKDKGFSE